VIGNKNFSLTKYFIQQYLFKKLLCHVSKSLGYYT